MSPIRNNKFIVEKPKPKKKKSFKRRAFKTLALLTFLTAPLNVSVQRYCLGDEKTYDFSQSFPSWSLHFNSDPLEAKVSAHYKDEVRSASLTYSNRVFYYDTHIEPLEEPTPNKIVKPSNRLDGL